MTSKTNIKEIKERVEAQDGYNHVENGVDRDELIKPGIETIPIYTTRGDRQIMAEIARRYQLNSHTDIVRVAIREVFRRERGQ